MEQTYLGRSGLVVSELCLGTMTFGGAADKDESYAIVEAFREAGGTFFDTADIYTEGASERILGEIVGSSRAEVVLATKGYGVTGAGPNDRSASRRHLVAAVDASLRRLATDYLDLYQIHAFDPTTPLEETLATLEDLVRAGKVLYVGVSNFVGWQIERACRLQEIRGFDRFVSLQPQYSLIERQIEFETLPAARANDLAVLAWSPLAAGFLTGKYRRGAAAEGKGRFAQFIDGIGAQAWATLEVVERVADAYGAAPASVALAWLRSSADVLPVIGATSADHLEPSVAATSLVLEPAALAELSAVSEPPRGYPWDFGSVPGRPARTLPRP